MPWTKISATLPWEPIIESFGEYPKTRQALKALKDAGWKVIRDDTSEFPNFTFKRDNQKHSVRAELHTNEAFGWYLDSENFLIEVTDPSELEEGKIPQRVLPEGDSIIAERLSRFL